jgi:hypothetical protein
MAEEKQTEPKEGQQPSIEYLRPEGGLVSIYANNVSMSPNIFDLRIYFGDLLQASMTDIKVLHKAEVIISWVEAKIFASFIQKQIEAFEKKNGPIKYPQQPDDPEPHNPFGDNLSKPRV